MLPYSDRWEDEKSPCDGHLYVGFITIEAAGVAQLIAQRQYITDPHTLPCHVHIDPESIEVLGATARNACRSLTAEALLEFKAVGKSLEAFTEFAKCFSTDPSHRSV